MDIFKRTKLTSSYAVLAYEVAVKVILSIIIIFLLATMLLMVLKSILMFKDLWELNVQEISKIVIINVLMVLALLEVFITTLTYFSEGRVRVTFIIDTVLVVVLTEVMAFWFKDVEYQKLVMVIALVLTLIVARILAIKFSPAKEEQDL